MTYSTNGHLIGAITEAKLTTTHRDHALACTLHSSFRAVESHFFQEVHTEVDVGLAISNTLNAEPNNDGIDLMTIHGCRHVSDLINSLDTIAISIANNPRSMKLDVEEAYILLCAAHLHDAGNIGGRQHHADRSADLLATNKQLFAGTERLQHIFDVARVHTGIHPEYGEDTFRSLHGDNTRRPRLPLLAAMLRLGDELSESPERVPGPILRWFRTSPMSNLAYRYAEAFRLFDLQHDQLIIEFRMYPDQHTGTVDNVELPFFQYLESRIDKLDREARYCSQYGRPDLNIRQILITLHYHKDDFPSPPNHRKQLTLDLTHGYPNELPPLSNRCEELGDGITLESYCRQQLT